MAIYKLTYLNQFMKDFGVSEQSVRQETLNWQQVWKVRLRKLLLWKIGRAKDLITDFESTEFLSLQGSGGN